MGTLLNLARACEIETVPADGVTVVVEAHSSWSKGWVAELTPNPERPHAGFKTAFLGVMKKNLSRAGNGEKIFLIAENGLYEAESVWRSYKNHRVIFRVQDGAVEILWSAEAWNPSFADPEDLAARDQLLAGEIGMTLDELRAARQADKEKQAEAKAAEAQALGLPELVGSPKQITWANDIRSGIYQTVISRVEAMRDILEKEQATSSPNLPESEGTMGAVESTLKELLSQTSAKWWIDNRSYSFANFRESVRQKRNPKKGPSQ